MKVEYFKEYSHSLKRDMEFKVYGQAGMPILAFPAQNGRFYDFEGFKMIDSISNFIEEGKVQVFCCDSIDAESWSNQYGDPALRIQNQENWYHYICDELVPRIHEINKTHQRILTTGCSMGATHAVNFMFRRPDIFNATIALSGYYDSDMFFGDYVDDLVYNNSPIKFIDGMSYDHPYVEKYRHLDIILCAGQGAWEEDMLRSIHRMKDLLHAKDIPAWIDLWGYDVNHDWPWWQKQLPYFLNVILEKNDILNK